MSAPSLATAEQWVRRLADDWEFDEGKHLTTLLAEYDRRAEVIERVCALSEEIQRQADINMATFAPTYLRGVEQAHIAACIRHALEDES